MNTFEFAKLLIKKKKERGQFTEEYKKELIEKFNVLMLVNSITTNEFDELIKLANEKEEIPEEIQTQPSGISG